jgi:hypothetical protein
MIAVTLTLHSMAALEVIVVIVNSILVMSHKWKHALLRTPNDLSAEGPVFTKFTGL